MDGDTNSASDIFVYDRTIGAIERVSIDSNGEQAFGTSDQPAISANGRFVAFVSDAGNLVPNDTNEAPDVFVHDRRTGMTTRVSTGHALQIGLPSISADGRYIAFQTTRFGASEFEFHSDVFVYDRQTGSTARVSVNSSGGAADRSSFYPSISADGRFIAFISRPDVLDSNVDGEVFVQDRQTGTTTQVSVNSPGEFETNSTAISADGRFVAFESSQPNLVPNDTNGHADIFVYDRTTASTTRVSVDSNGVQANLASAHPSISSHGRIVAFMSLASNLVPRDTNGSVDPSVLMYDIFTHDRRTGQTRRINVAPDFKQANANSGFPAISADGLQVAFDSSASNLLAAGDENAASDVFVRDRGALSTTLASVSGLFSRTAPGASDTSSSTGIRGHTPNSSVVSSTGRYVAFTSLASTLVKGDTNRLADIFLRDRTTGKTRRVSRSTSGAQANSYSNAPSLSANGRYVAFASFASNLIAGDTNQSFDVFVRDWWTGTTSRVSSAPDGSPADAGSAEPSISDYGRYVAFTSSASNLVAGDTNNTFEVYVRDRQLGTTARVSVDSNGNQANGDSFHPAISANGRYIAFTSRASNLIAGGTSPGSKVFVHDRQTGTTTLASINANGDQVFGADPSISADGRFVAFESAQDVYVRDRLLGLTTQVSVNLGGLPTTLESTAPSISAYGRYVAFASLSDGLVPGDTNGTWDVFRHDRETGTTTRVSVDSNGAEGQFSSGSSTQPSISGDGRNVVFTSEASTLVADDHNDSSDVFLHQLSRKTVIRINAAGPPFFDRLGRRWGADRGFNTGETVNRVVPISNTTDDALYQTERWDPAAVPALRYSFALPNGSYEVRLHFAENYTPNFGVGRRVFDVSIEGVRRFEHIDVFAEAGARRALVKSTTVNVIDGRLNILFRRQIENPFIDAIEVIQQ